MNAYFEDLSETRKRFTVELSAEEVAAETAKVLKSFGKQARVPGFRPGKAPESIIRKRFASDIDQRVKQQLLQAAYKHATEAYEVDVFAVVDSDSENLSTSAETPGGEVAFTVEVQPSVPVPPYDGLAVEIPPATVTDEEFANTRNQFLEGRAEFDAVEEPAAAGDFVRFNYSATVDGQPLADIAPEAPATLTGQLATWDEASSDAHGSFRPVAAALVGLAPNTTATVEHTFTAEDLPEDEGLRAKLEGKTARYEVEALEVRRKIMPTIDDDFLKALGVESEEEFNRRIRENIQQQKTQRIEDLKRQRVLYALTGALDFPVPESAIETERESILVDYLGNAVEQGATSEQIDSSWGQLSERATEAAKARLRTRFVLMEIAKKENIELQNEDLHAALIHEARSTGKDPKALVMEVRKDDDRLRELQQQAFVSKTLDLIVERATVTEVEPSPEPEAESAAASS